MAVHTGILTITASGTQTISFGNAYYENIAIWVQSGTGAGAIIVSGQPVSGSHYQKFDSGRIPLAAGVTPYKVTSVPLQKVKVHSSATASTTVIVFNAWSRLDS